MTFIYPAATFYILGLFGFVHIEAKDIKIEFVKHAQYLNAIRVEYTPRGKRKRKEFYVMDNPNLIVLEDWQHPIFENKTPPEQLGQLISTGMRFPSYSPKWSEAFDIFMNEYLNRTSSKILHDFRNHDAENTSIKPQDDVDKPDISSILVIFPEEPILEGAQTQVVQNKYERNPLARKQCIVHYGSQCAVCGFDFEKFYGAIGEGFIEVHHLVPLGEKREEHQVNPILDLRPVCSNCHSMLHRHEPPYSIDELKEFLQKK